MREQKRNTWRGLKKSAKSRNEEDREKLRNERKKLRVKIAEKKEKMKAKTGRIENSRYLSEFWQAFRVFRSRKKRKWEDLRQENLLNHFKKILDEEDEKGSREKEPPEEEIRKEGEEGSNFI